MSEFHEQPKLTEYRRQQLDQERATTEQEIDQTGPKLDTLLARRDAQYKELGMETEREVREKLESVGFHFTRNVSAKELFKFLYPYLKARADYEVQQLEKKRTALTPEQRAEIIRLENEGKHHALFELPYYVPVSKKIGSEGDYDRLLENENNLRELFIKYENAIRQDFQGITTIMFLAADAFNEYGNRSPEQISVWANDHISTRQGIRNIEPWQSLSDYVDYLRGLEQFEPSKLEVELSSNKYILEQEREKLRRGRYEPVEEFDDFSIPEKLWADIIEVLPEKEKDDLLGRRMTSVSYIRAYIKYLELTKGEPFKFMPSVKNGRVVLHKWTIYKKRII